MIEDYFREIVALINGDVSIQGASVTYDKRTPYVGFLRGSLHFSDGSALHVREYINVQDAIDRYMYVYQYQSPKGILLFRYDNSPHFPHLPTFPHHKHVGSETNVVAANPMDLRAVLYEVHSLLELE